MSAREGEVVEKKLIIYRHSKANKYDRWRKEKCLFIPIYIWMSQIEYECKILDIAIPEIQTILQNLWATYHGSFLMRRYVYDFNPIQPGKWIRLRYDGRKTTLTIKEISHDGIDGTREREIVVDSFDMTHAMLQQFGYTHRAYQENRRTSYTLDDIAIEIDERPRIPAYLEIEWPSANAVHAMVEKLGYTQDVITSENTNKIYTKYGIDLESETELRFG